MEAEHVGLNRLVELRPQPVEQRVRRLVRDDVVRQRREHQTTWYRVASRLLAGAKVSERQAVVVAIVVGVLFRERERPDAQAQGVAAPGRQAASPGDVAPECAAERRIGQAADGVDHLKVELTVVRRGRQSILQQQVGMIEIQRLGFERRRRARGVDFEQRACRPRIEILVRHVDRRHAAGAPRDRRIEREDPQRPRVRCTRDPMVGPRRRLQLYARADLVLRWRRAGSSGHRNPSEE